jgi:hypothetical protein
MNKINGFIVVATADNISKMTSEEISLLADLLTSSTNGAKLSNAISFAIQDQDYLNHIEVQEPVC